MRTNLPGLAALAAGGLFLTQQMRKRHHTGFSPPTRGAMEHGAQARKLAMKARAHEALARAENMRMPLGTTLAAVAALAAGGMLLSRQMRRNGSAHSVEESIELNVPVSTAYNQWTQFEEFPRFMASVESVRQIDDTHLHWCARVAGKKKEWDAEITEQIPDQRIAWRSINGTPNGGVVTFHKLSDSRTRVMLQMDYKPETMIEKVGDYAGAVKLTGKGNLKRFKKLVEERGRETGGWRGTVTQH